MAYQNPRKPSYSFPIPAWWDPECSAWPDWGSESSEPEDSSSASNSELTHVSSSSSSPKTNLQDGNSSREKGRGEERREGEGSKPPRERARGTHVDTLDFEHFKAVYPKRSGAQPWSRAVKAANARLKDGEVFDEMVGGC